MATFKELIQRPGPVLVDFYAEWCGPCKSMAPILEQLKQQLGGQVTILKVDIDRNPKAAQAYDVSAVPTLLLFREGKVQWRQSGVVPAARLKQVLEQHG